MDKFKMQATRFKRMPNSNYVIKVVETSNNFYYSTTVSNDIMSVNKLNTSIFISISPYTDLNWVYDADLQFLLYNEEYGVPSVFKSYQIIVMMINLFNKLITDIEDENIYVKFNAPNFGYEVVHGVTTVNGILCVHKESIFTIKGIIPNAVTATREEFETVFTSAIQLMNQNDLLRRIINLP